MMDQIAFLVVCCSWAAVVNVVYFIIRWYFYGLGLKNQDQKPARRVAIIEAVRGVTHNYHQHVTALLNQNHPCFRVIFCLEDTRDPAFHFLSNYFGIDRSNPGQSIHINRLRLSDLNIGSAGLLSVDIVTAGMAETCSQKSYNLNRAYDVLTKEDTLMAWVDADAELSSRWLKELLHPLKGKSNAAATGYRCLVPSGKNWTSAFISVINASILTLYGDPWRNSLWGGSMSMTRPVFETLKIREYVSRCFSIDASVSALLKKNGVPIYFSFAVIPTSKVDYSFRQMMAFARRQYMSPRFYIKFHIIVSFMLLGGFLLTFLYLPLALLTQPDSLKVFGLFAFISAVLLRGGIRFGFIRYTLGNKAYGFRCLFLETLGTPLVVLVHILIFCSAFYGNTVTWAGITYRVKGPFHVEVIHRQEW